MPYMPYMWNEILLNAHSTTQSALLQHLLISPAGDFLQKVGHALAWRQYEADAVEEGHNAILGPQIGHMS